MKSVVNHTSNTPSRNAADSVSGSTKISADNPKQEFKADELAKKGLTLQKKVTPVSQKKRTADNIPPFQLKHNASNDITQPKITPFNPVQKKANTTGMPDSIKTGIENLSGMDMGDVKVHYNSNKPAQLNAHAYAQGNQIHIASGQERHMPHEAWHVVQQRQGRVKPTMQMKQGIVVNDDKGLEKEADVMGAKAIQYKLEPRLEISNLTQNKEVFGTSSHIKQLRPWEKNDSYGQEAYIDKERDWLYFPDQQRIYSLLEDDEVIEELNEDRESKIEGEIALDEKMVTDSALKATYDEIEEESEEMLSLEKLAKRLPNIPKNYKRGKEFARGGTSILYEMEDEPDYLIKAGGGRISNEALGLIQIEMAGIPCVYVAQESNAIIVKKIDGVGSKDVVGRQKQRNIDKVKVHFITDKTIEDLNSIYAKMQEVPLNIGDFQFIIRKSDGAVFLNDPVSVAVGKKPAPKIKSMIELFHGINERRKKGEYD